MDVKYYVSSDADPFAEECAIIHQNAFTASGERGWTTEEFRALFRRPSTFLLKAQHGFLLADLIVDEVEILAFAVSSDHQGQKIGQALLSNLDKACSDRNVNKCILEVASDNSTAISLYKMYGFDQFAIRDGYFKRNNCYVAAWVMAKIY